MLSGFVLVLSLAADDGGLNLSLLQKASVIRQDGTTKAALLNDGVASTDGDVWDSPRAAVLAPQGVIEWDLGQPTAIGAMRLQADNNDRYLIFGSVDRASWFPIWVAPGVDLPGVQTRTAPPLTVNARFLRMTAEGGDSKYSVTEFEIFESMSALRSSKLERIAPPPPPPPPPAPPFDVGILVVLGVAAGFVWYFRWVPQHRAATARASSAPAAEPQQPDGKA